MLLSLRCLSRPSSSRWHSRVQNESKMVKNMFVLLRTGGHNLQTNSVSACFGGKILIRHLTCFKVLDAFIGLGLASVPETQLVQ